MPAETPNNDYRENPRRAVYVLGALNQQLVEKLTPQVMQLRQGSSDPITAYIDSQGGDVSAAENLRGLLQAPNQDGKKCRLITVATGSAASAAADFLALGDYAIAYPQASIIYHGTRQPTTTPLTAEIASSLGSSLQQANEFFAMRLANRAFPRFMLRLRLSGAELQQYVTTESRPPDCREIGRLADALSGKLGADKLRLVERAVERQRHIDKLTESVSAHWANLQNRETLKPIQWEVETLTAILNYQAQVHAAEEWSLRATGLYEVVNDFHLLHDYHFGRQTLALDRLVRSYGRLFMPAGELQEHEAIPASEGEKRFSFLREHAQPRIRPLWYFVVSLCRLLQIADHLFAAEEAYWLGLVDEVPGSNLPNERQLVEGLP
jgi:hypothetical protein